jgi:hypothetical protein
LNKENKYLLLLLLLLLPIFEFPHKNEKNTKIYIRKKSKKITGARKGCWNTEKRPKLVEKVQKYKKVEI